MSSSMTLPLGPGRCPPLHWNNDALFPHVGFGCVARGWHDYNKDLLRVFRWGWVTAPLSSFSTFLLRSRHLPGTAPDPTTSLLRPGLYMPLDLNASSASCRLRFLRPPAWSSSDLTRACPNPRHTSFWTDPDPTTSPLRLDLHAPRPANPNYIVKSHQ